MQSSQHPLLLPQNLCKWVVTRYEDAQQQISCNNKLAQCNNKLAQCNNWLQNKISKMFVNHSNTKENTFLKTLKSCGGRNEVDVSFGKREITESLDSIQEVLGLIPNCPSLPPPYFQWTSLSKAYVYLSSCSTYQEVGCYSNVFIDKLVRVSSLRPVL